MVREKRNGENGRIQFRKIQNGGEETKNSNLKEPGELSSQQGQLISSWDFRQTINRDSPGARNWLEAVTHLLSKVFYLHRENPELIKAAFFASLDPKTFVTRLTPSQMEYYEESAKVSLEYPDHIADITGMNRFGIMHLKFGPHAYHDFVQAVIGRDPMATCIPIMNPPRFFQMLGIENPPHPINPISVVVYPDRMENTVLPGHYSIAMRKIHEQVHAADPLLTEKRLIENVLADADEVDEADQTITIYEDPAILACYPDDPLIIESLVPRGESAVRPEDSAVTDLPVATMGAHQVADLSDYMPDRQMEVRLVAKAISALTQKYPNPEVIRLLLLCRTSEELWQRLQGEDLPGFGRVPSINVAESYEQKLEALLRANKKWSASSIPKAMGYIKEILEITGKKEDLLTGLKLTELGYLDLERLAKKANKAVLKKINFSALSTTVIRGIAQHVHFGQEHHRIISIRPPNLPVRSVIELDGNTNVMINILRTNSSQLAALYENFTVPQLNLLSALDSSQFDRFMSLPLENRKSVMSHITNFGDEELDLVIRMIGEPQAA